ncbi:mobilization protein, partial [Acinetobacter ursingii]|uniref:mobilization protein n=1 Tax=Acinetobacter ursingii TaxID=108980 RepID=UPI002449D100
PAKASAYLLDKLDHRGNVRAGIEVLKGDATTFNAVCDSSPHLWKYTSGVIAWSKDDAPTDEQIQEVLNDFEEHAFSGLDPSQYHLFAVLHTDDDGSKHIHVLAPRLDIQSGKSLNIAPPGHEKHFDSLRDYFNTKYQWSRPDDLLLMQTTQEPNHIAKLNKQAKKILSSQELETLPKKQFCKAIDNYVQTLLKTQTVENRADIVACITQLDGIDSIKPSKEFLTVTLNNGKKHRLKGDFYHEKFEIGSYSEHLRAAAESRPSANELAAALKDIDQLRATYRAKRKAYNQQHYAFTQSTTYDNSPRIAPKLDSNRDREFITSIPKRDDSELYRANRRIVDSASEYRYCGNIKSEIEHRFVFNLNSGSTEPHQQPVAEPFNRQAESRKVYSKTSTASDSESKRANREQPANADHGKIERTESQVLFLHNDVFDSVDSFNRFISNQSKQYKSNNNQSSKRSNSKERTVNKQSNQLLEQLGAEISHANRNRPIFDRAKQLIDATKQLVSRAKRSIESTSQFIKEHFDNLQRSRAELKSSAQTTASLDFGTANRAFKDRTGQLVRRITAVISNKLEYTITNAINESIKSAEFEQRCQRISKDRIKTNSNDDRYTAIRHRESSLENLAIESCNQLLRRFRDAEQTDRYTYRNHRKINNINQQLERLENKVAETRLKPKSATNFNYLYLRTDGYYPDRVAYHEKLCKKQQQAYDGEKTLQVIDYINEKTKNIEEYMMKAYANLKQRDYEKFEEIIKNDQRMLKYLQCEKILEPQNAHLQQQRESYQSCLQRFENIKSYIHDIKNPTVQETQNTSQNTYETEYKPKPKNDLDLGF